MINNLAPYPAMKDSVFLVDEMMGVIRFPKLISGEFGG